MAMVDALVRVRFAVPQLWIGLDAIGWSFDLVRDEARIRVQLPSDAESFSDLPTGSQDTKLPSITQVGPIIGEPDRDTRTAGLVIFEVTIEVELDFPEVKPDEYSLELRDAAEDALEGGIQLATEVAGLFVRHARASAPGQSWLGLSAHPPSQYGVARLEYRESGEMIFGLGPKRSTVFRSSRLRLERSAMELIVERMTSGEEPQVAESLLADAWHLADATGANDQDRAVLMAAVACEVKTKQHIRASVESGREKLIEMILKRRSNLPDLLDEVLDAACGISLRRNAPALFKQVGVLSRQRNAIVHTGKRSSQVEDIGLPNQVATNLFRWLDENISPAARSEDACDVQ